MLSIDLIYFLIGIILIPLVLFLFKRYIGIDVIDDPDTPASFIILGLIINTILFWPILLPAILYASVCRSNEFPLINNNDEINNRIKMNNKIENLKEKNNKIYKYSRFDIMDI